MRPPHVFARLRALIDKWATRRANAVPERNPKIIAILLSTGITLTPTALGIQPLPGSLLAHPTFGQVVTGFSALGCFMCVFGLLVPARWRDNGLPVEIAGCILLAAGMLGYAWALYQYTSQAQRAYAFGAAFGIGVGCLLRAAQIGLYVRGRRLADRFPAKEIS